MAQKTLQQLRQETLDQLRETASDSNFTADQINGYLNKAQDYIAAIAAPPEDKTSIAVEQDIGSYTLPVDTLVITGAYYGTTDTANDILPLTIITKTQAKNMYPQWLDATSQASGIPRDLILFDKMTVHLLPHPQADQVGKRIHLFYGFSPTLMSADGDVPSIRNSYHSILYLFACRLAYYALSNPTMAKEMMAAFLEDYEMIHDTVDKEAEETFAFKWSVSE